MGNGYPRPLQGEAQVNLRLQLAAEQGARGLGALADEVRAVLDRAALAIDALPVDEQLAATEPDDLVSIRALRPPGRRVIADELPSDVYRDRLLGAYLGRCAGCTLGAPVELRRIDEIEAWAAHLGVPCPPTDYWPEVERPHEPAYEVSRRRDFTPSGMDAVPADDDTVYTQLGLLVLEQYGPGFTTADVAEAWLRLVPFAHTAERVALANLRRGVPADRAAEIDNPYREMIGADIRADPWGYVAAGRPEVAAALAHRDAFLTHRRNGIFAAMYFAAVIAAAFTVDDPVDALATGLEEIPQDCRFAQAVRWALEVADAIADHRDANAAVAERFAGMHAVHAINNACLTVWGLTIGRRDFTKVIGTTVAMGYDNDCTAATAGSIAGAVLGRAGIPEHWWSPFHNRARSYLTGHLEFAIDDLVERFVVQAERLRESGHRS
jgi:ADP-ribosylglycohydrolase